MTVLRQPLISAVSIDEGCGYDLRIAQLSGYHDDSPYRSKYFTRCLAGMQWLFCRYCGSALSGLFRSLCRTVNEALALDGLDNDEYAKDQARRSDEGIHHMDGLSKGQDRAYFPAPSCVEF